MSKTSFKGTATVKTNGKSYNVKVTGEVKEKNGHSNPRKSIRDAYMMIPVKVYTGRPGRDIVIDIPSKTYFKLGLDTTAAFLMVYRSN